jgi:hypothetical protein
MKINERMTPKQSIVYVIVIGIAVFIAIQVVYGQEGNTTKLLENSSQQTMTLDQMSALNNHIKVLETLLNYCFEHASDSPNPIQDLVDKGLINAGMYSGKTCGEIRLDHQQALNQLSNSKLDPLDLQKRLEAKRKMLKDRFDALRDQQQKALEGLENK